MKILFLGDIMPGGVFHYQDKIVSDDVERYLMSYDLRVACLESAIGDSLEYDPEKMNGKMNIIYCKDNDFRRILELNINVVTLANNHVFDLGVEGFKNTRRLLEKYNIKYCGAGLNIKEASEPAVINIGGKTIAFIAFCQYGTPFIGYVPIATEENYGINPLDINKVEEQIFEAKKKFDFVIILPHWGREYQIYPNKLEKRLAYRMIKAGADAIIGGHTHRVQPAVLYRKRPIFYSLGNFAFPDFFMAPPRPMYYPESEKELNDAKISYDYPNIVDSITKRVWLESSRYGMMASVKIENKKLKPSYQLSYLTEGLNVIEFAKHTMQILLMLKIIGIISKTWSYNDGKVLSKFVKIIRRNV